MNPKLWFLISDFDAATLLFMSIPSDSKTFADPDEDDIALLPCFAILTPAPAVTKQAAVEILNVPW